MLIFQLQKMTHPIGHMYPSFQNMEGKIYSSKEAAEEALEAYLKKEGMTGEVGFFIKDELNPEGELRMFSKEEAYRVESYPVLDLTPPESEIPF